MKLVSIALLILLTSIISSCDKSSDKLKDQCFEVKILNEICGNAVVQILDKDLYKFGENGYQLDGITYDHVFTTTFSCADLSRINTFATSLRGLHLKVKVTEQHEDDPYCTRCAATIADAPQKLVLLKVVNTCK